MIKLIVMKIKSSELYTIPVSTGQILFCTDTRRTYYDTEDDSRLDITNDTLIFEKQEDMIKFSSPLVNKIALILEEKKLFEYNGTEWIPLLSYLEVERITTDLREFVPVSIIKNNKILSPRTTVDSVFTSDGSTIIAALDDSKKLRVSKVNAYYVQVIKDNQRLFVIPYPTEDYDLQENYMTVILRGKVCDPDTYVVNGEHLIFDNNVETLKGEQLLFIFSYGIYYDINKSVILDTHNFLDGSITSEKLSKSIRINAYNIVENVERLFFTPEEREKLSNIEEFATHYVHPDTHPATMITTDPQHRFVTDDDKNNWNAKANANDVYTKQETDQRIEAVIGSAPEALDTLKELANALGNDENFATTVMEKLQEKATKEELQQLDAKVDKKTDKNDYIRNGLYTTPTVTQKLDHTLYTVYSSDPELKEYIDGMLVVIKIAESNNKGPAKIKINDLPAKDVITQEGYVLVPEELKKQSIYSLRFNGTDGNFILMGKGGVKVLDTTLESHMNNDKDNIIRGHLLDLHDNMVTKSVPKSKTISYYETTQEDYLSDGKVKVLGVTSQDKFIMVWLENNVLKAQLIQLRNGFIDVTLLAANRPIVINSSCSDFEIEKVGDKYVMLYSTDSNVASMVPLFLDSKNILRTGTPQLVDEQELIKNLKVIPINSTDAIVSWEYGIRTKALLVRTNDANSIDIIFTRGNLEYHLDSSVKVNPSQILFAYKEDNKITAWVMAVTSTDFAATGKVTLVENRNVKYTNPTFTFLGNNRVLSMWTNEEQTELFRQFIEIDYKGGIVFQEPKTYMTDLYKIKSNIYPTQRSLGHNFYVSASSYYYDIPALTDEGKQCLKICTTQIIKESDTYRTTDIHTSMIGLNARNITFDFLTNDKMIIAYNAKRNSKEKSHIFFAIVETRRVPEAVAISNGEPNQIIKTLKW